MRVLRSIRFWLRGEPPKDSQGECVENPQSIMAESNNQVESHVIGIVESR